MEFAGTSFGGFDLVVFIILGFSAVLSFSRGLSREVVSIIALTIGMVGAIFLFGRYQFDMLSFIKPTWLANITLLLTAFGIVYLFVSFVLRGWVNTIRGHTPGFMDRVLGLAFGLTRGLLISSLIVIIISKSAQNSMPAPWMTSAKTYPLLRSIADQLEALPFAKANGIAKTIKTRGKNDSLLPDIFPPNHKF